MDNSTHRKRIATSIVLAGIPALGLAFQGWVLFVVLAFFSALTLWEFYSMFSPPRGMGLFKCLGAGFTFLLMGAFSTGNMVWPALVMIAAFWTAALTFLFRYSSKDTATFSQSAIFLAGLAYIPLNFHFFLNFNRLEILLVLLAAVVSDTAAFYAGTLFGKTKIWPQISPKKSWIGSMGGFAACVAAITALGMSFGSAPVWQWLILGAALNIAAQFGDFFESALKRTLGVKDSGSLLPGHGGFLDRVDSLLLVVPVYGFAKLLHPFFG